MRKQIESDSEQEDQANHKGNTQIQLRNSKERQNRLKWTRIQNIKYCFFLHQQLQIFNSERLRKKTRIFSLLSEFIDTRTTTQVKSHHQKTMKRHKQIKNIIHYMQRRLGFLIVAQIGQGPQERNSDGFINTEENPQISQNILQSKIDLSDSKEEKEYLWDFNSYFDLSPKYDHFN